MKNKVKLKHFFLVKISLHLHESQGIPVNSNICTNVTDHRFKLDCDDYYK